MDNVIEQIEKLSKYGVPDNEISHLITIVCVMEREHREILDIFKSKIASMKQQMSDIERQLNDT